MSVSVCDTSSSLIVQHWQRYGHDRAYVRFGARDLGFRDLLTGNVHCLSSSEYEVVASATEELFQRMQSQRADGYRPRHALESAS